METDYENFKQQMAEIRDLFAILTQNIEKRLEKLHEDIEDASVR